MEYELDFIAVLKMQHLEFFQPYILWNAWSNSLINFLSKDPLKKGSVVENIFQKMFLLKENFKAVGVFVRVNLCCC